METILIASDHAGFGLKEALKSYLGRKGLRVNDLGTDSRESCDYPAYAAALAKQVSLGKAKRGILICYTGIGNSIVANRFPRVRASLCYNRRAARLTRQHNDSNVLVLGAGFVSAAEAKTITGIWLTTKFEGGRHRRRINLITQYEKEGCCRR